MADKLYRCINYSGGHPDDPGNLVVEDGCITQYVWYNRARTIMQQGGQREPRRVHGAHVPSVMVFHRRAMTSRARWTTSGLKFPRR